MKEWLLRLWKSFCFNRNGFFFLFFFAQSFSPSYWKYVYLRFPRKEISWPTLEFKSVLKAHFSSVEILPRSFPINCAWCDNDLLEFFKKEKKRISFIIYEKNHIAYIPKKRGFKILRTSNVFPRWPSLPHSIFFVCSIWLKT